MLVYRTSQGNVPKVLTVRKCGLLYIPALCSCFLMRLAVCRMTNVFVIGKGDKPLISLPKGKGIRLNILQEQAKIYGVA